MSDADLIQGTDEWRRARAGSLGASSLSLALARTRTGWGASRANIMADLIGERLTGAARSGYVSPAMQHGTDTEAEARSVYEMASGVSVGLVGLVRHPEITGTHASPDGRVGALGLVEIKCPETAQHLATLLGEPPAHRYWLQCQWQMECDGREWCDLVSYDPRLPEDLRLHITRIERDDEKLGEIRDQVLEFLTELEGKLSRLNAMYRRAEAAE